MDGTKKKLHQNFHICLNETQPKTEQGQPGVEQGIKAMEKSQQWSEQSTGTYMRSQPPTRWSKQKWQYRDHLVVQLSSSDHAHWALANGKIYKSPLKLNYQNFLVNLSWWSTLTPQQRNVCWRCDVLHIFIHITCSLKS